MRFLIHALLLTLVLHCGPGRAETIILAADLWCPYNCEPGTDKPGFMVEIARKVFASQGIEVDYRLMPWSRAVQSTREGDYHAVIGATRQDAQGFVFPALEQGKMRTSLWAMPDLTWRYNGVPSLSAVILGVSASYSYGSGIDAYIAEPRNRGYIQVFFGTDPLAHGLKMLNAGRIDVMVEDDSVFRFYVARHAQELTYKNVGVVDNPVTDTNVYIAFSPARPDSGRMAEMLSDGMARLRASGELLDIMQRYGLQDWRH